MVRVGGGGVRNVRKKWAKVSESEGRSEKSEQESHKVFPSVRGPGAVLLAHRLPPGETDPPVLLVE